MDSLLLLLQLRFLLLNSFIKVLHLSSQPLHVDLLHRQFGLQLDNLFLELLYVLLGVSQCYCVALIVLVLELLYRLPQHMQLLLLLAQLH